ncbi:hypothetical protein RCO48_16345 [Peribacillus frigoritolerans]|nr:hypothetical protein [Peribacillus frigoritolerans]
MRKGCVAGFRSRSSICCFFGGIGFAVYKGIPVIVSQVRELSESVPELVEQYRGRIDKLNHQTAAWPFRNS